MVGVANLLIGLVNLGLLSFLIAVTIRRFTGDPIETPVEQGTPKPLGEAWVLHLVGLDGKLLHEVHLHRDMRPTEYPYGDRVFIGTSTQNEDGSWVYRERVSHD